MERELRSERTKRMSLEDQLIECQRTLYGTEREVQRIKSTNVMITLKMDELKAKLAENGNQTNYNHAFTRAIPYLENLPFSQSNELMWYILSAQLKLHFGVKLLHIS